MQTNRNEFFIKRDFGFYDTGILGVLPDVVFNIYEILRRYVWRSLEVGDPKWKRLFASGKLAATVPQSEISAALDRARQVINEHIATIKRLGWVKVIQDPNARQAATYILGERVRDSHGHYHEVFYADAWMRELWDRLETAANVNSDGSEKVSRLPWDERREICRAWMAETTAKNVKVKLEPKQVEPESSEDQDPEESIPIVANISKSQEHTSTTSNLLKSHSDVSFSRQGVSGKNHTSPGGLSGKADTIIEKPSASKNRELEQQYRPASERGVEHLNAPRRSRTQTFSSTESEKVSRSKELKNSIENVNEKELKNSIENLNEKELKNSIENVNEKELKNSIENVNEKELKNSIEFSTSPRTEEKKSSELLDLLTENKIPESSASAPVFSSKEPYTSNDDLPSRLTKLTEIAEGKTPALLDRTGETYRAKVERERARQAQISASKAARLRNFDGTKPYEVRQVLKHLEAIWAAESKAKFGPAAGAWQIPDRKMVEGLLKSYTVDMIESGMKYLVGNWEGLSKRMFKGNGGLVPSLGVLSRCHATIIPESAKYAEVADLANEWNGWWTNHPDDSPPSDLQSRYDANRDKLKALGLV